jgi:hypothetical protein
MVNSGSEDQVNLNKNIPEFPKQVKLELPKLQLPKLQLPKLK